MTRRLAVLLLPLMVMEAAAQAPATATSAPVALPADAVRVALQTTLGPIVVAVDAAHAPITARNFLRYVDDHRLDGTSFYRAVTVQPGYGLVQGGTRNDPKRVLPPIPHEPTSVTGLSHRAGTISMARLAPGSATGDFFIVVGDLVSLDAGPTGPGDQAGFAAFGRVVAGMDVVERVMAAPTAADGPPGMAGQMLAAPVRILSARRIAATDQAQSPAPTPPGQ